MNQRLIRIEEVTNQTGLPRDSIYYQIRNGNFPLPIKISRRSAAWVELEVQKWIEQQIKKHKGDDWLENLLKNAH